MIGDRVIREARPRGRPPKQEGERKEKVTLRLSPEVLTFFRAQGDGWQTRIDRLLLDHAMNCGRETEIAGGSRKRAAGR